jgi:hypothetical protein
MFNCIIKKFDTTSRYWQGASIPSRVTFYGLQLFLTLTPATSTSTCIAQFHESNYCQKILTRKNFHLLYTVQVAATKNWLIY